MDSFSKMISEVKVLLINPKEIWMKEKDADGGPAIFIKKLGLLMLVLALTVFLGEFFKRSDFFFEYPVLKAVRELILILLQYLISVFFTKELMKTFGGEKDVELARKLVAYSMIPLLLVSIITGLFPFLYVLDILGLYGFYIFWLGARELVKIPESKVNSYILITIVVNFFVFSFLSIFLSKLLNAYY